MFNGQNANDEENIEVTDSHGDTVAWLEVPTRRGRSPWFSD